MAKKEPKTYILHGWAKNTTKWKPLIKYLKNQGVNPILLKIPGLTAPLKSVWTLDDYVTWLSKTIGNERKINLIAHSFGGRIALKFDVKYPNTINKLILIDSAGIRPSSFPAIIKRYSFLAVAKIGKKLTSSKKARKILYKFAREKDYLQADKALKQTMANVISQDQRNDLPFVKAHTLIIWGSQDNVTPLADGRLINKNITGSRLQIIDQAKHSPHFTHTKDVAKLIIDFLNK